jgi:hypothetical protein
MSSMGCSGRDASHFPAGEDSLEGCYFVIAVGANGGGFGARRFLGVKVERDAD